MAVVGYARVSSIDQNLARQEEELSKYGVDRVYKDKLSGKDTNRPKLQEMLNYVREGDTVVVHSVDRLGRNAKDLHIIVDDLKERGVGIKFIKEGIDTCTDAGKLIFTILAGVAEMERNSIRERQRQGIGIAKREGKYQGRKSMDKEEFYKQYERVKQGKITSETGYRLCGISKRTWYNWVKDEKDKVVE